MSEIISPPVPRGYMAAAGKQDWRTPPAVLEVVRAALGGPVDLDPCASRDPVDHLAKRNLDGSTPELDGLIRSWHGRVFANPEFCALGRWTSKARAEHRAHGCEVVLLLPSRTDTKYWHEDVATATAVCLWRGRLTFVGAPASCPFAIAFAYWGFHHQRFAAAFGPHGMVFRP